MNVDNANPPKKYQVEIHHGNNVYLLEPIQTTKEKMVEGMKDLLGAQLLYMNITDQNGTPIFFGSKVVTELVISIIEV